MRYWMIAIIVGILLALVGFRFDCRIGGINNNIEFKIGK